MEDPKKWCQEFFALDKDGDMVIATSEEACRWCPSGAIRKVYGFGQSELDAEMKLLEAISKHGDHRSIPRWNDDPNRMHYEVLAIVKEAGILS